MMIKVAIGTILALGAVGYCFTGRSLPLRETTYSSVIYVADFTDKRRLAGFADNVFVGKVVAVKGSHAPSGDPETLFHVQVVQNLKGTLQGIVLVNQEGGYAQGSKDQELELIEGDSMLVVGSEYLFATKYSPSGKWHTLVPKHGDVALTSEDVRKRSIAEFEDAVRYQIPLDASTDPKLEDSVVTKE